MPNHPMPSGEERRDAIRRFIEDYIQQYGFSPTVGEISEHCGISKSTANYHIVRMASSGSIGKAPHKARALSAKQHGHRCKSCGQIVLDNYGYCPWCGSGQI